jgi:hypothetical protein
MKAKGHIQSFNEHQENLNNELSKLLTEATHETFQYENVPNPIIDRAKDWILNNPSLTRRKPEQNDFFKIEVFGYQHKQVADDLYNALKESGFLDKYPLFSIRIDPMQ